MLWVTTTTVYSFLRSKIRSSIFAVAIGSRAEQGSSIRSTSGFTASARAMHSRCCCPPDRLAPLLSSESFTSSQRAACFRLSSTAWSSFFLSRTPFNRNPAATLSPPHGPHPDHGAGSDADAQHQEDEDEGRAPGRAVLCEGGAHCESIHLRRQGRDRLIEPVEEVVVPRGGHDQRGRFPSDAGDAEEGTSDKRARARREDDPKDGPVSEDA